VPLFSPYTKNFNTTNIKKIIQNKIYFLEKYILSAKKKRLKSRFFIIIKFIAAA